MGQNCAFALIEFLVAIANTAVLAAILFTIAIAVWQGRFPHETPAWPYPAEHLPRWTGVSAVTLAAEINNWIDATHA